MKDRFLLEVNYDHLLNVRADISRGCKTCSQSFQGLCDEHLIYFSEIIRFLESNIPFHYIRELMESEPVEKKCREYCLEKEAYLKSFNCYEDLIDRYISSLSSSVISNGYSFFFFGFNGAGKTHTALNVLFSAIKLGLTGYYISFKDLINLYNKSEFMNEKDSSKLYRFIINCDMLVIDEVGKESSVTDNLVGSFEHILKHRTSLPKPTILVSNIDFPDERNGFMSRYGSSVANSLLQHYRVINFSSNGEFRLKMRQSWSI
jgi:DNA replication protein DnaC